MEVLEEQDVTVHDLLLLGVLRLVRDCEMRISFDADPKAMTMDLPEVAVLVASNAALAATSSAAYSRALPRAAATPGMS